MMKKTLIFDFDGTIADTHLFLVEIYNSYAQEFNCEKIDTDDLDSYKDKNAVQIIKKLHVPIMKIPVMIARAKKHFHEHMEKVHPFEGIAQALRNLKDAGHRIGILSSNSKENIHKFLGAHDLEIFDFIHSTNRVLSKHFAIKKLIGQLNCSHKDVLYIGDEIRDIEAAKNLEITMIAVSWGYNLRRALEAYQPDHVIDAPEELQELLKSLEESS